MDAPGDVKVVDRSDIDRLAFLRAFLSAGQIVEILPLPAGMASEIPTFLKLFVECRVVTAGNEVGEHGLVCEGNFCIVGLALRF